MSMPRREMPSVPHRLAGSEKTCVQFIEICWKSGAAWCVNNSTDKTEDKVESAHVKYSLLQG